MPCAFMILLFATVAAQHAPHYCRDGADGLSRLGCRRGSYRERQDVFFQSEDVDSREFYLAWMIYRNEDRFEICRYIFSAFLRYMFVRGTLPKGEEDLVKRALERFVAAIYAEAEGIQDPARFCASRTNLGSLALGMLLSVNEAVGLARRVAGVLHRRGVRTDALWDGSVERTLSFLEGFLDYWEAILLLEQQGEDISELLPDGERP
jgi:hypothetical protein